MCEVPRLGVAQEQSQRLMIRPRFDVEATVVAFQLQHFIGTNFTEIDNHVISICSHMHAESTHQEGVNGKQGELHCDDCAGYRLTMVDH